MLRRYIIKVVWGMLSDPAIQDEILSALEAEARKTTTKLDDQGVEAVRALFQIVFPRIFSGARG